MRKLLTVLIAAGAIALPVALTGAAEPPGQPAVATCFWEGPISTDRPTTKGFDGRDFNFPEESATYWLARFNLPSNTSLFLRGRYPHGRYMSLNAYSDGVPTDALSDIAIKPQPGHTNPFIPGALREAAKRSYEVRRARPAATAIGLAASPEHALRAAGRRRLDRAALPGVRARSRPRPDRRHHAAAARAQDVGREHGEARGRLRRDQQPRPLDPCADRSRGDLAGRALDPALRPADEPRLRPAALGTVLQPELRAARRGQRLHRGRAAGPPGDGARAPGRLLLEPRQRLHLRPPQPRLRPSLRGAGTAAGIHPHGHDARAHARHEASLLVTVQRRVAGHDPDSGLPRRPPGTRPQRP